MPHEPLEWYDHDADNPPWLKALAEVRKRATQEGSCYQHVQAIVVAIDQYAEKATGNREFFLNRSQRIGGKNDDVPQACIMQNKHRQRESIWVGCRGLICL